MQFGEKLMKITGYTKDGVFVGLEFVTNFGRSYMVGAADGESHVYELFTDTDKYEIVAFRGSWNDDECLSSFTVYYQITDSCNCVPELHR
jgi:hypothetical protein